MCLLIVFPGSFRGVQYTAKIIIIKTRRPKGEGIYVDKRISKRNELKVRLYEGAASNFT